MLKKIAILTALLCAVVAHTYGQEEGDKVIEQLATRLGELGGSYYIDFELLVPSIEAPSKGRCVVDGSRYTIAIDGVVQGCDGQTMWLVNPLTREVTLDRPNTQSHNILENPAKAFDFATELFDVVDISYEAAMIHLILKPAEGVLDGVESLHLVVDSATMLPSSLCYDLSGSGMTINVAEIAPYKASDKEFACDPKEQYPDYEIIDFR